MGLLGIAIARNAIGNQTHYRRKFFTVNWESLQIETPSPEETQLLSKLRELNKLPKDPNRHNARGYDRKHNPTEFIAVDGEGMDTPDGDHIYVLLSVGDESLHNNGKPLERNQIFGFLWEQFLKHPDAVFVGYFLDYDFTMWLKSLPEYKARLLFTKEGVAKRKRKIGKIPVPFPVRYEGWEFDLMLPDRRFKLRPIGWKAKNNHRGWFWLSNVGPFFQTSFLAAIDPSGWDYPIVTLKEYSIIKAGKAKRDIAVFGDEMIHYNVTENLALAKLMGTLESGFRAMGIYLKKTQWIGPGQTAQEWLKQIKAPDKDDAVYGLPNEIKTAAIASYYGGWFEIAAHGHIRGNVWEYDINSAYPYVISHLPCLKIDHGKWHQGVGGPPKNTLLTLAYVTVKGSDNYWGTLPCRTLQGKILRPMNVRGWYWKHEIDALRGAGLISKVKWHKWFQYEQLCDEQPFAKIAELYNQRLAVGKKTPLGVSLKLAYNSSYGKLAQSVGDPKYSNPVYASLVTAGCRAIIAHAMGTHPGGPNECLMVATDAVFFTSPHPYLPVSMALGDWDETVKANITLFMPGVYWDDAIRFRKEAKIRSRGIRAVDLKEVISKIDLLFETFPHENVGITEGPWPFIMVPIKFSIVSCRLALHRNNWLSAGRVSHTGAKILNSDPTYKRNPRVLADEMWTVPWDISPDGLDTVPYEERFGLEMELGRLLDGITEDGVIMDDFYEELKR